ncbi:uncharacterized protein LOC110600458 isoform X1 [Manihot esculenta]|uniref:BAH domain-containing protein n=2 Tax=Manihot esculenta TaxID=3983 RepID=A0A2C9UK20_MANES|nr:uncharacterized protein LOC110600458 isoform X1 [Manihot esculenta]OAY31298.1 hypothetical protein MANES_14G100700v8 [Manihot esculenta]
MERFGSPLDTQSLGYVSWEEVNVSTDKGRREIRYYLKRIDGGLDLAIVGKEKSLRHMSYHYAVRNRSILSAMGPSSKLKSRREVIYWLNSIVSDSLPLESSHLSGSLDSSDASAFSVENNMDGQLRKLGYRTKEFLWLGSPWTCRKRRKHYHSFQRNGIKISVHDFVYVLAEEDKRLVAYLEDMYEDSKENKMVVVRWFHKIDEVGIALPRNFNDREIFFSLCLQDLSIECIDGRATILSPQHFEKFLNEVAHTRLDPFVCCKQFDNEDTKPFDITQVKGYWKQEILRYMYMVSPARDQANSLQIADGLKVEANVDDDSGTRPRKRHRHSKDDVYTGSKESTDMVSIDAQHNSSIDHKSGIEMCSLMGGESSALLSGAEAKQSPTQHLKVGSEVEVLSQDSGIRGCWFRALIIKIHKDKMKVRYQDIKDADNETNNLEEWILATKGAVPDQLGIRICGRSIVRPSPKFNEGQVSWGLDVGTAVDVWRHDVWQEGIIIHKESEDRFGVYFPGEKQASVFGRGDLRHSQEWLGNGWMLIKARLDVAHSVSSISETKQVVRSDDKLIQIAISDSTQSGKTKPGCSDYSSDSGSDRGRESVVPDLSKDSFLAQLRWNVPKKRRRGAGSSVQRCNKKDGKKSSTQVVRSYACDRLMLSMTRKVDHENCKYMGDSLFSSAVAQSLTSLVMSR